MLDKGEVMTTLSQAETNSIGFPIKKKKLSLSLESASSPLCLINYVHKTIFEFAPLPSQDKTT